MSDDRTAFLIADVSGKGLGAALLTTMLQGALSGMTIGADPARVINHINSFLCEHSEVGRYATMFFGVLSRNGDLEYINAGHPSPLLLRKGKLAEPFTERFYSRRTHPRCGLQSRLRQTRNGRHTRPLQRWSHRSADPNEQLFGVSRLRDALANLHDSPLDHLQKAVFDSVENFTRGASQADDITLLLVRYRAAAQSGLCPEFVSPRTAWAPYS